MFFVSAVVRSSNDETHSVLLFSLLSILAAGIS